MRDIKFRAWNRITKHFSSFTDEHKISDINSSALMIFMQYTGLKDKNGVEIYESDIIKVNGNLYEVWHSGLAFGLIDKNKDFFEYMCQLCDMNGKVYEVIGNIYENPELLENNK